MQDMEQSLASKARESRSVSFNGVSVMVDAALKWNSISKDQQKQLADAIDDNKIEILRRQASLGTVNFELALQATIIKVIWKSWS